MTLHMIKLSVGTESLEELAAYKAEQAELSEREAGRRFAWHTTRMVPTRRDALLDGGSVYWVIRGEIRARQRLLDLRESTDEAGRRACVLELDPTLVKVVPRARRPFQGWRYLKPEDAPPDLAEHGDETAEMPEWMRAELRELGLL